jgi:hypothetical protein
MGEATGGTMKKTKKAAKGKPQANAIKDSDLKNVSGGDTPTESLRLKLKI